MKEFLQPSELPEKENGSVWKTLRNMKNAAVFSALLSLSAPAFSFATEKEPSPENNVAKIILGRDFIYYHMRRGEGVFLTVKFANETRAIRLATTDSYNCLRYFFFV